MARAGGAYRKVLGALLAAGLSLALASAARATQTFSDESAFLAAAGDVAVEGFEELPADDGFRTTSTLVTSRFTISTDFLELSVQDAPVTGEFATEGSQYVDNAWPQFASPALNVMVFDFDGAVEAFGVHITDWGDFGEGTLEYADDAAQDFEIASTPRSDGNEIFFGVVSTEPITQVVLGHDIDGEAYGVDEVLLAPEPRAEALARAAIPSLAALAASRRRRRGALARA